MMNPDTAPSQSNPVADAGDQDIVKTMPPSLSAMIARAGKTSGRPPVDKWDPPHCGKINMRIAADGSWHYKNSPINRDALVRLFASVLRLEPDGSHCLVTPVEKIEIEVDDAPFVVVEMHVNDPGPKQTLTLRTNVGDVVIVGANHPLRFAVDPETDGLKPYVEVRRGLMALFARQIVHELADHADEVESSETDLVIHSGGVTFRSSTCTAASSSEFG